DNVLGDPVGDELLVGVAAHIGERQHRHRGLVRQCERGPGRTYCLAHNPACPNAIHPQRTSYVLNPLLPRILEREIELVAHLVAYEAIDANPAGFGQRLESRRNVNTIAVDVATVLDDVAEINPHTELDAPLLRH